MAPHTRSRGKSSSQCRQNKEQQPGITNRYGYKYVLENNDDDEGKDPDFVPSSSKEQHCNGTSSTRRTRANTEVEEIKPRKNPKRSQRSNVDSEGKENGPQKRGKKGRHVDGETVMEKKQKIPTSTCTYPISSHGSTNILHYLESCRLGNTHTSAIKARQAVIIRDVSDFRVWKTISPFDRRVTFIRWHPTKPNIFAAGSKSGDVVICNANKQTELKFLEGIGAGGSIQALQFDKKVPTKIYTASVDAKVCVWDLEKEKEMSVFLNIFNDFSDWFTSLDLSYDGDLLVSGSNKGYLYLLTPSDGQVCWSSKLHKKKITHAEFNPKEQWLLATASVDGCVKMWDIRNVKGPNSALQSIESSAPVNSAYFSMKNGARLLTTHQNSEMRIFQGPLWNLERIIQHPHRQFQHLTPIKATWHPLEDIVVVGRYPDANFPGYVEGELRSIDFYDADRGQHLHELHQAGMEGIVSLNHFNPTGDILASGMGYHIVIWKSSWHVHEKRRQTFKKVMDHLLETSFSDHLSGSGRKSHSQVMKVTQRRPPS